MQDLKDGSNPGPLSEIEFWRGKASSLNAVTEQLASKHITRVLELLQQNKSTFFPAFEKLLAEVAVAGAEANDNIRFLTPLAKCVPLPLRRASRPLAHLTRMRLHPASPGCLIASTWLTTLRHCPSCFPQSSTCCCWSGSTAGTTTPPGV